MLNDVEKIVKSYFLITFLIKNSHELISNARGQVIEKENDSIFLTTPRS